MKFSVSAQKAFEYVAGNGRNPFSQWLLNLNDRKARAIILRRINQAEEGNFGAYRALGDELFELKVQFGPGYRIYFGLDENILIILLCGGDKGSQKRDISHAREYWDDYRRG
jgi:putative addiction module killer protein